MPPNNQSFNMPSSQRKERALLDKFVCRTCHKTKAPNMYAQNELNLYRFKVSDGTKLNAVTAGLKCRSCKGEQLYEKKCLGPCGLVRVLNEFSKAQRTSRSYWCKECVAWKESQEPGIVSNVAPNGQLAPDEEEESDEDDLYGFPEGDADSDYGEFLHPWAPIPASDVPVESTALSQNAPPPQMTIMDNGGIQAGGRSNPSTTPVSSMHSMGRPLTSMESTGSSNPYQYRNEQNTASVGTWSVVDPRERAPASAGSGAGALYNAYNPLTAESSSVQSRASARNVSGPSGSTGGQGASRPLQPAGGSTSRSGWARPFKGPKPSPVPTRQSRATHHQTRLYDSDEDVADASQ